MTNEINLMSNIIISTPDCKGPQSEFSGLIKPGNGHSSTFPQFDTDMATAFLKAMLPKTGQYGMLKFSACKDKSKPVDRPRVHSIEEIVEKADEWSRNRWDVSFATCSFNPDTKGQKRQDVKEKQCLYLDIDIDPQNKDKY